MTKVRANRTGLNQAHKSPPPPSLSFLSLYGTPNSTDIAYLPSSLSTSISSSTGIYTFTSPFLPSHTMANGEDTVMSDHNSDNNEDAASDRSVSPEQNEAPDTSLPAYNPSNIPDDAVISDSRVAQKTKKKPKVAAKAPEGK